MFKQTLFYLEKNFLSKRKREGRKEEGETCECKGRVAVLLWHAGCWTLFSGCVDTKWGRMKLPRVCWALRFFFKSKVSTTSLAQQTAYYYFFNKEINEDIAKHQGCFKCPKHCQGKGEGIHSILLHKAQLGSVNRQWRGCDNDNNVNTATLKHSAKAFSAAYGTGITISHNEEGKAQMNV